MEAQEDHRQDVEQRNRDAFEAFDEVMVDVALDEARVRVAEPALADSGVIGELGLLR